MIEAHNEEGIRTGYSNRAFIEARDCFRDCLPFSVGWEVIPVVKKRRKEFGNSWWSSRWIAVLESFGWANRLSRGRTYARWGNVLDVHIVPGHIKAEVQGSRRRPYLVKIDIDQFSSSQWDCVIESLSQKAVFSAKLLNGDMPQDIEDAFAHAGVSLLPEDEDDINSSCSCPDWANPCKHIAAVFYVLAEEFDRDPFLLFKIRGRDKEDIMDAIRASIAKTIRHSTDNGGERPAQPADGKGLAAADEAGERVAPDNYGANPREFWDSSWEFMRIPINCEVPESLPYVKRLGAPPFCSDSEKWMAQLLDHYSKVSEIALDLLLDRSGQKES